MVELMADWIQKFADEVKFLKFVSRLKTFVTSDPRRERFPQALFSQGFPSFVSLSREVFTLLMYSEIDLSGQFVNSQLSTGAAEAYEITPVKEQSIVTQMITRLFFRIHCLDDIYYIIYIIPKSTRKRPKFYKIIIESSIVIASELIRCDGSIFSLQYRIESAIESFLFLDKF